jgi:hypothetical protein
MCNTTLRFSAFTDKGDLAAAWSGHNVSRRLLQLTADSRMSHWRCQMRGVRWSYLLNAVSRINSQVFVRDVDMRSTGFHHSVSSECKGFSV